MLNSGSFAGFHSTLSVKHSKLALCGFRPFCAVLGAALFPVFHAGGVEAAAHHVIAHARQILYPPPTDQHHGVLLQVVSFTADVADNFKTVGEPHLRDLAQGGREVLGIAREPGGAILAASRGSGLNRIDPASGAIERIGADLPDMLHAVTVSPHDPRCIYVGSEPAGIYVSCDGGAHFDQVESVGRLNIERKWTYPIPSIGTHIRHIVVDADDPNLIYAAVQVGGLICSTDSGKTWSVFDETIDPDVHSVLQHPTLHDLLYVVCGGGGGESNDPEHKSGRPIYRSKDRGKTWRCVSGDFSRTYGAPLGVVPGAHPVILAGVGRGIPPSWRKRSDRADSALMISEDDGETWQSATSGLGPRPKMFEAIAVSPGDKHLFLGTGIDVGDPASHGEIYYASGLKGEWQRAPVMLPGVAVMMCV